MLADLPSTKVDLRIRAIVDGHDTLKVTADNLQWTHHTWQWPKKLTVNDNEWDVRNRPILALATGENTLIAEAVDLSSAILEQHGGRDRVTLTNDSDGVVLDFRDGPNGDDTYDVTLRLPKLTLP